MNRYNTWGDRPFPAINSDVSNRKKDNNPIIISIYDSDKFFVAGLKAILEGYFHSHKKIVLFQGNYSPSSLTHLVFFSVPVNRCEECHQITTPSGTSNKIYIPIKNTKTTRIFNKLQCTPDASALALFRNQSCDSVLRLLDIIKNDACLENKERSCALSRIKNLSVRENEVIRHMRLGASQKETAEIMGLSAKTTHTYKTSAMRKLGFNKKHEFYYWLVATANN